MVELLVTDCFIALIATDNISSEVLFKFLQTQINNKFVRMEQKSFLSTISFGVTLTEATQFFSLLNLLNEFEFLFSSIHFLRCCMKAWKIDETSDLCLPNL